MTTDEIKDVTTNEKTSHWRVTGVSVPGLDHEKIGALCQDAHHFRILRCNVLVSAVADGAGSALMGDLGAKIAVKSAVRNVRTKTSEIGRLNDEKWRKILIGAFKSAQKAIAKKAEVLGVTIRELATTLILVIASPEFIMAGQIGDGTVILIENNNLIALTKPQSGEYINETTFIILPNALDTIQIESWHGNFTHLAIITDGLQMLALKMPECVPYEPFFTPLFRFVSNVNETEAQEQLTNFLRSQRVRERTTDDLTLLLATLIQNDAG